MPYLGREGQFGIRERFQYLASNGDTSVSGADANGITMTFSDGLYIDVFLNGVKLKAGEDYNTNTANTVAGISAMNANDEVEVIAYDAFTVADTVSAADGGTFSGNVAMSGTLSVTGNMTMSADASVGDDLTLGSDAAVINLGADNDVTITHNHNKGVTLNSVDISGLTSINGTDSGSGENYGQIGGRRNFIYNGNTEICQRETSVASLGNGNSGYHVQDRWRFTEQGAPEAEVTMSKSTNSPDGFASSLKFDCTTAESSVAADEQFRLEQRIEGQDLQSWNKGDANARPVTLSFFVNATKTGTNIVTLYDSDNNRSCSKSYTVSSADTWEYKTITFPADTTGAFTNDTGTSLQILFLLMAGSNFTSGTLNTSWNSHVAANSGVGQVNNFDNTANNFHITGIQLELGETATPFEHDCFQDNLLRCRRYFKGWASGVAAYSVVSGGVVTSATQCYLTVLHDVPMRAAPTFAYNGTVYVYDGGVSKTVAAITANYTGDGNGGYVYLQTASGLTQGRSIYLYTDNDEEDRVTMDAEL